MTVLIISLLLVLFLLFYKWKFTYWKRRKLLFLKPYIPYGNIPNPLTLKQKPGIIISNLYKKMKSRGWKHGGFYLLTKPIYLVVDLDYTKNILTKDFQYFSDRGIYNNEIDDPLSCNIFTSAGDKWKNLRCKFNPAFTSNKMKMMLPLVIQCAEKLLKVFDTKTTININDVFSSFTVNVIGTCAFGLDCNTVESNNKLRYFGQESVAMPKLKLIILILAALFPNLAKKTHLKVLPKKISKFFMELITETVKYRNENNYKRSDFMQLMIDLQKSDVLTMEEIAAQSLTFLIAGFDTSASVMMFLVYEICKNEDVQEKIRDEIRGVLAKNGDKISYESIAELRYLQQVIEETQRKYPAMLYITRKCVKDYKIPNEDVIIEKGTIVIIPVHGIHYDEEFYPNPDKFDPERFNNENKNFRHKYAHLPYGEGPRVCIGKRFGLMQTKVSLVLLLKKYKFKLNGRTKEPIGFRMESVLTTPAHEIWVDVEEI